MAERMSLLRVLTVEVVVEPMTLHRVCGSRGDPSFLDALRSHYELDRPPRGPENRAAAIHMALSMFDSLDVARQLADRVPKLGGHIATLELRPDLGICVARTGGPAHWSVWGRPPQLASCIATVEPASSWL
jgi:hypothetical protein